MPSQFQTMYNINFVSTASIADEQYTNVGSSSFQLGEGSRSFKGGADMVIRTASGGGGTLLVENTDYTVDGVDQQLSSNAGYTVYNRITIINPTYQTGDLFFTYEAVHSYTDAAYFNQLRDDVDTALAGGTVNQKYMTGYGIANNTTDSARDIDISPGQCANDANSKYLTLTSSLTKQIDAAFSKGNNQGGLDTGTVANNTFYYFWAIEEDSTSDIDILISASQTSPTMPAGWTAKRRIRGAVLTDGSANILEFLQSDNEFTYDVRILDVSDSAPGTGQNLETMSVPPNFKGKFSVHLSKSSAAYILVLETWQTNISPSISRQDVRVTSDGSKDSAELIKTVDSNSQIGYRSNTSTVTNFFISTLSFFDNAQ